jgi:AraC family transcriptional regulator, regulatory protein of adaptative response / methylated-DNA-[protein]-cysteine methyltransferase
MTVAAAPVVTEDPRWLAVVAREPRSDFVYAVATTRIYCRPSCPSRRPRPEHVRYFPLPAEAERHGFRACRRCRPDEIVTDARVARVEHACRVLAANVGAAPSLDELATAVGATRDALRRDFRRYLGVTPKQYADGLRVEALRAELRSGRDVTGALYTVGYGSSSRLYEQSDARLGMTPASYGAGGAGARISFTTAPSPLGLMAIARTDRGVCRILLGATDAELEAKLRDEFPAADMTRDDDALVPAVEHVLARIDGAVPAVDLPLDMRGTAFQLRVWQELRAIPRGETRSYGEVAEAVGAPRAARAVGSACRVNPVGIVVPCHRVIASDGGLGGYAWGLDRKERLLATERAAAQDTEDAAAGDERVSP